MDRDEAIEAANGLFIVRVALHHMIASHKGAGFLTQLESNTESARAIFQTIADSLPKRHHNRKPTGPRTPATPQGFHSPGRVLLPHQTSVHPQLSSVPSTPAASRVATAPTASSPHTPAQTTSASPHKINTLRLLAALQRTLTRRLTTPTLLLRLEAVNTLLVLGSIQLYAKRQQPPPPSLVLVQSVVARQADAHALFESLHQLLIDMRTADAKADSENLLRDIAHLFTLPFQVGIACSSRTLLAVAMSCPSFFFSFFFFHVCLSV